MELSYVHICAERLRSGDGRILTFPLRRRGYVHTYAERTSNTQLNLPRPLRNRALQTIKVRSQMRGRARAEAGGKLASTQIITCVHTCAVAERRRSGSKIRSARNGSNTQFAASTETARSKPSLSSRNGRSTPVSGAGMSKSARLRSATVPRMCERSFNLCSGYGLVSSGNRPFTWTNNDHYGDVIMSTMASQINSLTIVCWNVYSGADQRKHQSPASLAFVKGIYPWPVNSPHKWLVTRKMFPFDDVSVWPSSMTHRVQWENYNSDCWPSWKFDE